MKGIDTMKKEKIKEINKNGMSISLSLQDGLLYVIKSTTKDGESINHAWDLDTAMELFDKIFERHNVKRGH